MRLLSPGKANNNTTFVIAGRLFTAFPPVRRLQDLGQTGSLRFDAELRTALASFPAFLGSEVQNVQNVQKLHTGMPKLPLFAEAWTRIGGPHKRVFYFPLDRSHFNPATKFSFGAGYPKTSS